MKIIISLSGEIDITDSAYHKLKKEEHDDVDVPATNYKKVVKDTQIKKEKEKQEKHFKHKRMLKRARNTHTAVYKQ